MYLSINPVFLCRKKIKTVGEFSYKMTLILSDRIKTFLWIMLIKVSIKTGIRRSETFLSPCMLMMHSLFYLNIRWVSQYKKDIIDTVPCIPFLHFSTYDLNLNSRRMIFQTGFNLKCKLNGRVILFSIKSLCEIVCIPAVFYSVISFQVN